MALSIDRDKVAREALMRAAGFGLAGTAVVVGGQLASRALQGPKKPKIARANVSDLAAVLGSQGRAPIGATTLQAREVERDARRGVVFPREGETSPAVDARRRIDAGDRLNRTLPALIDSRGRGARGVRAGERFLAAARDARDVGVELPAELGGQLARLDAIPIRHSESTWREDVDLDGGELAPATDGEKAGVGIIGGALALLALL